jgi:hypothetical protein
MALWQDARLAFRLYRRTPLSTAIVWLSIALTVGAKDCMSFQRTQSPPDCCCVSADQALTPSNVIIGSLK